MNIKTFIEIILAVRLIKSSPRLAHAIIGLWDPINMSKMNKYKKVIVHTGLSILIVFLMEKAPYAAGCIIVNETAKICKTWHNAFRLRRRWRNIKCLIN